MTFLLKLTTTKEVSMPSSCRPSSIPLPCVSFATYNFTLLKTCYKLTIIKQPMLGENSWKFKVKDSNWRPWKSAWHSNPNELRKLRHYLHSHLLEPTKPTNHWQLLKQSHSTIHAVITRINNNNWGSLLALQNSHHALLSINEKFSRVECKWVFWSVNNNLITLKNKASAG